MEEEGRTKTLNRLTTSGTTPGPPGAHPLSSDPIDRATLELLEAWRLQDATHDPEQVRAAEQELTEFKKSMNENRTLAGERLLYP
jgi:hypothetical protein